MVESKHWSPKQIKTELTLSGITQAEIARRCNVSRTQVFRVINGSVSGHVRLQIAKAINRDLKDVWPD